MAIIGDTVRLTASFYNFNNSLADPENVAVNIYEKATKKLINAEPYTPVKASTGIYYYDYTIPDDVDGSLVFEFSGILEDTPTVGRRILEKAWL